MDSALDTVYKGIRFLTDRILGNIASVGLLGGTLFASTKFSGDIFLA